MNWVDLTMAIVLIGFAIRGLMKGFFREVFALVGLFLGLWMALLQFVAVGDWLRNTLPLADPVPYHVAFLGIFLGVSLVAGGMGFILHKVAKVFLIGWLDAIVGLGFGVVKGVMILTVLLFLIGRLPLSEPVASPLRHSTIARYLEFINPFVEQSVHAYQRLGGDRLWEQLRVPAPSPFSPQEDQRTAGEALTR
ncbi:MAG TPA: CvpA family protein [Alphaproteobacteria bacterium]|nr:CvpA family protein [Alphaproteobacteria bacterium]